MIKLILEQKKERGDSVDFKLFQMINNLAEVYTFLNPVMRFLAEGAQYLFYLGILIYWFTRTQQNRRMIMEALISACISLGFGGILANLFYRDRPFVTHNVIQLINHPANASFPSDHATAAFVIATSIWLFRRKDGLLWIIAAGCISFSRIWTGVHYPSDIIAGALIGITSAVVVHRVLARWLFAQKVLNTGMDVYDKIEQKFWTKKEKQYSGK
jgi:undecaprenyl-diphosphatase